MKHPLHPQCNYLSCKAVDYLRAARQRIIDSPRTFNMGLWFGRQGEGSGEECGTMCCIAGWISLNERLKETDAEVWNDDTGIAWVPHRTYHQMVNSNHMGTAQELLGITNCQMGELFFPTGWPERFRERYEAASRCGNTHLLAAEVIDDFIERYATEEAKKVRRVKVKEVEAEHVAEDVAEDVECEVKETVKVRIKKGA